MVDYKTLVGNHRLKQDFLNFADDEPMEKLFSSYEKFQEFENSYMTNEEFKKDLGKIFHTNINPSEYYVKELLRILNLLIHGKWLHDKFVGFSEYVAGKKPFKDTKFAQLLTKSYMEEYKGRKWSGIHNSTLR